MSRLATVTSAADGKPIFLNPDHVRWIHEVPGGTQIVFTDGTALIVKDEVNAVVAAIQDATSNHS